MFASTRDSSTPSPATNGVDEGMRFNADTSTIYSYTRMYGSGSIAGSDRSSGSNQVGVFLTSGSGTTANTFGSHSIYIPNYTGSNFKSFTTETIGENNNSVGWTTMYAGLYRSTSAITSLTMLAGVLFTQYSTFSLYGVLQAGI